jgi:thiosulfate dehydrogenase
MQADQKVFHYLLEHHREIHRSVNRLDRGVETLTESDNPEVAVKIQEHVASMRRRVEDGRGLRFWDELFVALFRKHASIKMSVENTRNGVKVIETSDDPNVVPLIQAHADVVSRFVAHGFDEAHKNHPIPSMPAARAGQKEVNTTSNAEKGSASDVPMPLPPGELGRIIALGKDIVERTGSHPLSKAYVGNSLTCSSCHLDAGTHPAAATFLGVATAYPAWSPRETRVITLEDRVLNCFMRSMNGIRPPNGSEVSVAVTTYITWLSTGQPIAMNPKTPLGPSSVPPLKIDPSRGNANRGAALFADKCSSCHGKDGLGNEEGPPVWGMMSYNDGAGLSKNDKLAAWLKVAMPMDDPSLTDQEALDVASFVNSRPRPKFVLREHLPDASRMGQYNSDR